MRGLGTIINVACIIAGGLAGLLFGSRIKARMQETLMAVAGVAVVFLGLGGALEYMLTIVDGKLSSGSSMLMIASLALGATEIETYFRVTAPAAKSGIAAAVVLGVGRAIGEAMAIMMVAGNAANMPSLFSSVKFLTTAVASEMSYAPDGSLQKMALFSIGLVLFVFIMMINIILNVVLKREKE